MLMFHHDNRVFSEGDTIIGNHYDIRKNILSKYQSSDLFPNMSDVLYMTNRVRENWEYDNVYQVIPKGKVIQCHTHYSVVLCQQEMKRCIDRFKALEIRPDWSDNDIESKYIHLMYEAYLGNYDAAGTLDTYFGYDYNQFEEYEWICQSAVVVYEYVGYHTCIDRVCAASIMRPVFDALYNTREIHRGQKDYYIVDKTCDEIYDKIVDLFNF